MLVLKLSGIEQISIFSLYFTRSQKIHHYYIYYISYGAKQGGFNQ